MAAIRSERDEVRKARRRAGAETEQNGLSEDTVAAIRAAIRGVPPDFEERARQQGVKPRTIASIRATCEPVPE